MFARRFLSRLRTRPSKRISVGLVLSVGVVGVSLTASHSSTNAVLDELDSKAPDFRWLDVTTQNFDETLPVFEEHLKKAVFVSIDTEFTGLTKPGAEDPTYKDMPYEYYRKKALSAREFIPVQIGVCVFVKPQDVSDQFRVPLAPQIQEAAERNLLVALPFNFYVFPRQYTHNATKLPDEKSSGTWRRSSDPALRHDPSFLAQSGSIEFLAQHGYDFNKTFSQGISFLNADQEAHFKKIGFGEPVVAEQNEAAFNNALGFRRAMKLLFANNDKSVFTNVEQYPPVVGHNMLLDLMHIYNRFETDLPDDLCTFKREIHRILPVIVDTKNMAYTDENLKPFFRRTTALDPVYTKSAEISPTPSIIIPQSFGNMDSSSALLHQAAYDAFITGFAFARMAAFVNEKQLHSPFMTANDKAPNEDVHPVLAGAKKFHNELHMMFSKYKVLYLTKFGSSFADQEKNEK